MAYGKIKVDTVVYDNAGSDVEVAVSGIPSSTQLAAKANIASPTFTGTASAPTATSGTNTTHLATTEFVTSAVAAAPSGVSLSAANTWTAGQRGEVTTLTDAASIATDLNDSNNYTVTLAGNRTLANPTNCTAGQSGSIFLVQDGTGSRTLAFGSYWDFAGAVAPTLSTAASAVDRIDYVVRSATSIHAVATLAYS